jgi:hypothetical protein
MQGKWIRGVVLEKVAPVSAASNLLVGKQGEPALDLVEPGGPGRCGMQVLAGVAGEASLAEGLWVP